MLACLDWIRQHDSNFEFVAIAPEIGPLAQELTRREIEVLPWFSGSDPTTRPTRLERESQLLQLVERASPDLLHANSLSMGRLTGSIARRLMIPTSTHLRDIIHVSASAMAELNCNRRLIAVSQATVEAHVARGMERERIVVIRNGVDLAQFQPRPRQGWLRRELQLADSSLLIATIGQIGLRKGQDVLAIAAPDIIRQIPSAHFLMLGERTSTKLESIEFEQSIHRSFAEQNLTKHLHMLGYRNDVATLLPEIDLIVHPANQEPFGRVLLEAAASGVPVVATRVGGTEEIVVDGVTGILVPARDPAALADAVVGLLRDASQREAMSVAARHHAVGNFEITQCARQLVEEWRRLIESNP